MFLSGSAAAGFCKQQLWPLFHYVLPMSPSSAGRFNSELWQAYVKANKVWEGAACQQPCSSSVKCALWYAGVEACGLCGLVGARHKVHMTVITALC